MNEATIVCGDCIQELRKMAPESAQCCVTSPPYFALRDYGHADQIGLEATPAEYIAKLVAVFREVWRVLRPDGTLWLNLGDSYNANGRKGQGTREGTMQGTNRASAAGADTNRATDPHLKPKDLLGIPWRVALALQADGWWLRTEIIWHKPNAMPDGAIDRPTRAHEYMFLMARSEDYFYDEGAIREPGCAPRPCGPKNDASRNDSGRVQMVRGDGETRNKRTVWTIAPEPYPGAHFAAFPPDLVKPCILAGTRPGDAVLDPFAGSGTTGMVALEFGRSAMLIELNPEYVELIRQRTNITPGLNL